MDKHEVNRLLFCMKERDELKALLIWYRIECDDLTGGYER